jgi:hypothetical protein
MMGRRWFETRDRNTFFSNIYLCNSIMFLFKDNSSPKIKNWRLEVSVPFHMISYGVKLLSSWKWTKNKKIFFRTSFTSFVQILEKTPWKLDTWKLIKKILCGSYFYLPHMEYEGSIGFVSRKMKIFYCWFSHFRTFYD